MTKLPDNSIQSNNFLSKIIEIQSRLTHADFDLDAYMNLIAEEMQNLTPATGAVVELIDGKHMVYRAATGTVASHLGLRLNIENSISGLCVSSNQVLRSDDTETDIRVNVEACRKISARSLIVTPLVYDGKPVGVLKILSNKPNAFTENDVKKLQLMAGFIASGLAHQLSYETNKNLLIELSHILHELATVQKNLYYLAHYDALTDLANRRTLNKKLNEMMSKARRSEATIALMFLDIDHFKSINDNFGHDIGDNLLKNFALRLKQCVRDYDVVARIGGDEFVIILNDVSKKDFVFTTAEKIILKMSEKFAFEKQRINISTSIGIAFYTRGKISSDDFLKQADTALYNAKNAGRNTFKIFDG